MITIEQEMKLSSLSKDDQIKELKSFLVDMMDLTEQTDCENIYIEMYKLLED